MKIALSANLPSIPTPRTDPLDHAAFATFAATHVDAVYTGLRRVLLPQSVADMFVHEPHKRQHAASSAPAALTPPHH